MDMAASAHAGKSTSRRSYILQCLFVTVRILALVWRYQAKPTHVRPDTELQLTSTRKICFDKNAPPLIPPLIRRHLGAPHRLLREMFMRPQKAGPSPGPFLKMPQSQCRAVPASAVQCTTCLGESTSCRQAQEKPALAQAIPVPQYAALVSRETQVENPINAVAKNC